MTRSAARRALSAVILAPLIALAPALSATALEQDVETPGWRWLDVSDDAYVIQDVESFYADFFGSGVSLDGWRDDAFDDLMRIAFFDPDIEDSVDTYPYVRFGPDESPVLAFTPVSGAWVSNGLTQFISTATADFGDGRVVTVTFTMRVEESTVQWSIAQEVVGGDATTVGLVFGGDLGSDSDTTFIDLGSGAWVSHDENRGDPVIAWLLEGGIQTPSFSDGSGRVEFVASAETDSTITVGVIDFDECSFDEALATMSAAAPTLAAGMAFEPIYVTDCLTTPATVALGPGQPASDILPLVPSDPLIDDSWAPFDAVEFAESGWRVDIVDGPAGLIATLEWVEASSSMQIRLSGTPTEAWSAPVTFVVHTGDEPVLVQTELSVELAATGVSPAAVTAAGIASIVLLLGGVLLRRRSTAAH